MKIQIQNLRPNPYRDIENYPIDQEKIQSLKESIQQTGFWDNILARQANGKFQIAYGHHRLEVLRQVMKPTDEVDIPVKELSDALMIKIMANENMDEWKTSVKVIDETVRVAKKFLEEHPEEVKLLTPMGATSGKIGCTAISKFLGWNEHRINYSLERLRLIKDKVIDKEAIEQLPTERSARDFVKAVRDYDLPIEKQKEAVKKITETSRGERAVRDTVIEHKWKAPEKKKVDYKKEQIRSFENFIGQLRNQIDDLNDELQRFIRLENELGKYDKSFNRKQIDISLKSLSNRINLILNQNEFTDTNSSSVRGQLET